MNVYRSRQLISIIFGGMLCLISSCNNYSVSEKQAESFMKYYPVDINNNSGTTVLQTSDGGYAILGNYDNVPGQKDIFVIITDEFGRQKTGSPHVIGTAEMNDHGYSMIDVDDGYVICGTSYSGTQRLGYLVKIANDGTVLWDSNYSRYQEMEFRDIAEAKDGSGNLIITGYGKDDSGDSEVILIKTSAQGETIWSKKYLLWRSNEVGEAIIEYQGRYYIVTTYSDIGNTSLTHIRILNTDTDGRGETDLKIEKPDYLSGKDITFNAAGTMYILGNREDPDTKSEIYLAELLLTEPNRVENDIILPDIESLHAASFAPVGEDALAIGGWQRIRSDNDILFLLVDNDFHVTTRKTFEFTGFQISENIIFTRDQGYALTGSVDLGGGRISMLLKLDYSGELR